MTEQPCLKCGYIIQKSVSLKDTKSPKPGDIEICVRCANLMQFDERLNLIPVTQKVLEELMKDSQLWNLITEAKLVIKKKLWK